jgi:hypothetical protein
MVEEKGEKERNKNKKVRQREGRFKLRAKSSLQKSRLVN